MLEMIFAWWISSFIDNFGVVWIVWLTLKYKLVPILVEWFLILVIAYLSDRQLYRRQQKELPSFPWKTILGQLVLIVSIIVAYIVIIIYMYPADYFLESVLMKYDASVLSSIYFFFWGMMAHITAFVFVTSFCRFGYQFASFNTFLVIGILLVIFVLFADILTCFGNNHFCTDKQFWHFG